MRSVESFRLARVGLGAAVLIFLSLLVPLLFSCAPGLQSQRLPTSQVRTYRLSSVTFGNERLLRVYVPAGYDGRTALNVLYLNDGQNAIGVEGLARRDDWRVDEVADSLIGSDAIPPMVIVGIDNIGTTYRGREYLPWEDVHLSPPIPEPEGRKYPHFIVDEVMPFIEQRIRVKHEGEGVGIVGFSYGGLSAIFVAMSYPDHFGVLLADVRKLVSIVESQEPETMTKLQITECGTHSFETASTRLAAALTFLYGS